MGVRIASGSELKKVRTFINKDGTITTPQEGLKRNLNSFSARNYSQTRTEETGETQEKNPQ